MNEKFIFHVQGSAAPPYKLELSLNPLTISCTCQAAIMGIPCKHRIHVLKGHTYQIIDITPAIEQAVELAAAIIKGSDIPGYIERYENLKKEIKTNNENSEKVFRKYRSAIIEHALNKGTAKEAKKASADLDKALQDCLNTEVEAESLLQAIKTVFIRHSSC